MSAPYHTLNSGLKMPCIGFGTMAIPKEKLVESLKCALDNNYRLFDGAEIYGNEKDVGDAFKVIFAEGKYKREDIFYVSKLFNHHHAADDVAAACRNTLKNLQFPYLDLYLIHWPFAVVKDDQDPRTKNAKGKARLEKVPLSVTWQAMELLVKDGLVKSIGVSNFPVVILNDLLSYAKIPPAINQIEINPFNQRSHLVDFCNDGGIHMMAYFPTIHNGVPQTLPHSNKKPFPNVINNPVLLALSKKYNKTISQIMLKWGIQRKVKEGDKYTDATYGVSVIPRSTNPVHIKENIDILDFTLTDAELDQIAALDEGYFMNIFSQFFGFPVFD